MRSTENGKRDNFAVSYLDSSVPTLALLQFRQEARESSSEETDFFVGALSMESYYEEIINRRMIGLNRLVYKDLSSIGPRLDPKAVLHRMRHQKQAEELFDPERFALFCAYGIYYQQARPQ